MAELIPLAEQSLADAERAVDGLTSLGVPLGLFPLLAAEPRTTYTVVATRHATPAQHTPPTRRLP
jgi:hypothetical protein